MNAATHHGTSRLVWASYKRPTRQDDHALIRLFRECFPGASSQVPSTTILGWRWKYAQVPTPSRSLATLDETTGQLVSFVGGLRLSATAFGEQTIITQSVDNMTAPDYRYANSGVPVFSELLGEWWRDGFGPEESLLAYGFPTQLNLRVGARTAEWEIVEDLRVLLRSAQAPTRTAGSDTLRARWSGGPPRDADDLWQRCRGDHTIAINRDRNYLLWRYTLHPVVPFRFVSVRDGERLRGLAVVTPHRVSSEVQLIVDWIVPLHDEEAIDALLTEIGVRTTVSGGQQVGVWFPLANAWSERFSQLGFQPYPWDRPWVARSADPSLRVDDIGQLMYATLGDVDSL